MVQHNMLIKRLECNINNEQKVELFGALGAEGKKRVSAQLHDSAGV